MRQRKSSLPFALLKERLGLVVKPSHAAPIIWIHAVSVGETNSIEAFVAQLKREKPDSQVYITSGTAAAHAVALNKLNADYVSMLPYDFLPSMLCAFLRIRPSALITVEAEWWPNFFFLARFLRIPTYGLNSRLSVRSLSTYQRFSWLAAPLFQCFTKLFVQTSADKKNFEGFGIAPTDITVLGNLKAYNVQHLLNAHSTQPQGPTTRHPLTLMVGSMHPGEWPLYKELYVHMKGDFPELRLIIAPRHFSWQHELEADLAALPYCSLIITPHTPKKSSYLIPQSNADIIAVCRIGELFSLIPLCDIYYLGGTFVPIGGHSLLEPAAWSKTTIVGPHLFMTQEIGDRLETAGGLFKTTGYKSLEKITRKLLEESALRHAAGKKAGNWLQHEAAVVTKHLQALLRLLP